jgi:EAL domain-containing protein (putative c-di-GMP-specific phosphodiesterase class I)
LHLNVSPRQLTDPGLADEIAARCQQLGVPTERLCLELTETHLATDPNEAMEALQRLSNIGCHLALDDFGTGFSTIGWLSRFPIDTLKIDQTFVAGMATKADDRSIVRLIIQLANELNLELIAEGIETVEQENLLRELGCSNGQGYRFSRPIGAEIITARLRTLDWIPTGP